MPYFDNVVCQESERDVIGPLCFTEILRGRSSSETPSLDGERFLCFSFLLTALSLALDSLLQRTVLLVLCVVKNKMADQNTKAAAWTAYPSLLETVDSPDIRADIELAAQARQCGRYAGAHEVFANRLPDAKTLPLLVYEYADLLTDQGLEGDRLKFLSNDSFFQTPATGERQLLDLMLADAGLWVEGRLQDAVESARKSKHYLRSGSINDLSDIHVSIVQYRCSKLVELAILVNGKSTSDPWHPALPPDHEDRYSKLELGNEDGFDSI